MYDAMLPDYLTALNGVTPPIPPSQVPQNQALVGAISGQPAAPENQRLWGSMTPEQGRAEVSAALPGYQQAVEAKQGQLSEARARPDEAPALSFMGMPVVSATEARESAERQLQEAQAKKAHAEAQLAGEAALPTTTPLRNAAESAFQAAGTSYASVPKFAGYIGGWLANEAGSGVEPTDNAVFRLGDQADKWAKSTFPGDPARAEEFGTKAAHLTGFLASLYGAGGVKAMTEGGPALAAKIGDAVSKASQAALVTSGGAMTQFEPATAAMEAGKEQHPMAGVTITPQGLPVSERDRAMATLLGAGVGLTSLIPMASTMATAGEREAGAILARALEGSGVNAAQMAAFNVLNNAIAREYYDPNRSLTQGLESDVGLGALAGGATHAFAAATGPKRLSTPEEVKAFIDAAQHSDPDPAKAAYWRGMREMADEKLARLPPPGEPGAGLEAPPPVNLAEAGPYALRGIPDWREEAHARGALREGEEVGAPGKAGEGVGGPGEGAVLPREERKAPPTRPVVGTESFDLKDKNGTPLAGFVTNLPSSEKYKAALHFTVYPEGSSVKPFESPKRKLGEPMADVKMRQHHDGTWDIGIMETQPQHERRGIMSSVLNAIEQRVGQKLGGSGLFWEPGYNLWSKRDPEAVKYHQLVEGEGYLSPAEINRQLEANRKSIDELDPIKDWEHIQDLQKDNRTLQRHLDAVPPEGKTPEKLASPLALRGFYNPATRVVEETKQGSMPADQWLKMLQGAGQKGVQKRHLDELGVQDFLEGKGKVTKDELLEHMRINEAPLEEVIHGEEPPHDPAAESRIEALESIMGDRALTTEERQEYRGLMDKTSFSPTKFEKYRPFELGENPKEFVIRDPRFKGQYDEPHYTGPVALHLRTWDLKGPNGEKILGVGEIQSTLHQEGRQKGYNVSFSKEDEQRLKELELVRDRLEQEYRNFEVDNDETQEERLNAFQRFDNVREEIGRLYDIKEDKPIPKAALSDSWLDVGMKRALQYAAENGYDGVTWAKAEQIAPAVGAKPEALAADYDKKIPSFFQKFAKKYGADTGTVTTKAPEDPKELERTNRHAAMMGLSPITRALDPGQQNTFIRINDKMRADIVEKGLPMARTPERALRMMDDALGSGKAVAVSKAAQGEVHDAIAPVRHVIPEDVGVHALARIEPREGGGLTATFRDVSGADIRLRADSLSDIANLRGFCLNDGANVCITNFFAGGGAAKGGPSGPGEVRAPDAHGGVFMHEAVHSLLRRGLIPADDWARLVNHANSLRVLDMPMHEYLGAIGEDVKPGPDTLRDNYKIAYQNYKKSEVEALLNEEEPVAHMMELFHHGHFKGDQMQPVADLLQKFVSGAYSKPKSGGAPGGERSLEDIQGELEKGVKGLYGGEFKGKDFEDFGTHGWWALGEGKSTYGDPDVLKRLREKFPDLVNQYSKAYKAKREARLKDLLSKP